MREPGTRKRPERSWSRRKTSFRRKAEEGYLRRSENPPASAVGSVNQDVCFRCDDTAEQKELRAGLSRAINVNVEPLTSDGRKSRIESHGFATEQKVGAMTVMDPKGMIHDAGVEGALKIMFNAMKQENHEMFSNMFRFFNSHKDELGYVANFSTKPLAGAAAA